MQVQPQTRVAPSLGAREVRAAAGGLLGLSAAWPLLPVHPAVACPLRSLTGIPCPLCGMTRACVAAVHGHLVTSARFNPAGVIVVLLAAVLLVRPAWRARLRRPAWAIGAALGALWLWNIGFNPTFHHYLVR